MYNPHPPSRNRHLVLVLNVERYSKKEDREEYQLAGMLYRRRVLQSGDALEVHQRRADEETTDRTPMIPAGQETGV